MKSPLIFPSDIAVHPSFQVVDKEIARAICNHYYVDKLLGESKFVNIKGRVPFKKQNLQVIVGFMEPHPFLDSMYYIKYLWLHYRGCKGF